MRAVISLGTNTARLLVVRDGDRAGDLEEVEHLQIGTRLGEGLRASGPLAPEAVERTLEAVRAFRLRAGELDAEVCCIATSAVRRAENGAGFAARVAEIAGAPLEVLDGDAEARASFRGATYGAARDGRTIAVLDIGGGSTELAVGRDGDVSAAASIEIGSVRVSESFPELMGGSPGAPARAAAERARAAVDAAIEPFRALGAVDEVRCVAGTPLTLAAIAFASHVDRVSGRRLSVASLEATLDRLLDATVDERRALPGMLPQRADILVGGGLILAQCLRLLGANEALLESRDLLLGHLLRRAGASSRRNDGAVPMRTDSPLG